ncbi:hypothetical protein MMC07_003195 [Pseudocyphellaria aurata]|nr:hypothetical protein [Pseudocyphellaria aurata]
MVRLRLINYLFWGILASTLIHAQSAFVSRNGNDNITFALNNPNAPSPKQDVLNYYLSGPIEYSWIAVGFGGRMRDAFMFIIYTNGNGKNITVSPRVADGNSEPSLDHSKTVRLLENSATTNDRYTVRWECLNCREWKGGSLNASDEKQQMIYAVGPRDVGLDASNPEAALRRHDWYGRFEINMTQAISDDIKFQRFWPTKSDGASEVGYEVDDHDFASPAHAVLMTGTFVILFPLGIIWLRIFGNVRLHWLTQIVGVLVIFIGAVIGILLSKQYNRAKHFTSSHQIIGFVILFVLLLQAGLGAAHHRIFKKTPKPTLLSSIHRILGPLAIGLGVVNGALGFKFALVPRHIIGYAIVIIIVSIIAVVSSFIHNRSRRRQAVYETPAARNFQSAYVAPEYQNDIPLAHAGVPPAYSRAMEP